jgi:hypothetical protein
MSPSDILLAARDSLCSYSLPYHLKINRSAKADQPNRVKIDLADFLDSMTHPPRRHGGARLGVVLRLLLDA